MPCRNSREEFPPNLTLGILQGLLVTDAEVAVIRFLLLLLLSSLFLSELTAFVPRSVDDGWMD